MAAFGTRHESHLNTRFVNVFIRFAVSNARED